MPVSVGIARLIDSDGFSMTIDDDHFSVSFIATEQELGQIVDQILDVMGLPKEDTLDSPFPWTVH